MSHQFFLGQCPLELAQGPASVALAWHKARGSTPFGVTVHVVASMLGMLVLALVFFFCFGFLLVLVFSFAFVWLLLCVPFPKSTTARSKSPDSFLSWGHFY